MSQQRNERRLRRAMIVLVIACVAVFLAIGIILHSRSVTPQPVDPPADSPTGAETTPPAEDSDPENGYPETSASGEPQAGAEAEAEGTVRPPTREDLGESLAREPHLPPAGLIEYAEKLAPKMEAAETSVEKARAFLKELEDCVMSDPEGGAKPVQALCLANAAELAEIHPELKSNVEAISKRAPSAVRHLLEAAESID